MNFYPNIYNYSSLTNTNTAMAGINVYVGDDGLIHFVDSAGADTVLPFSKGKVTYSGTLYRIGGTASGFNISSICSEYKNITVSNIYAQPNQIVYAASGQTVINPGTFSYSYVASTGVLTITHSASRKAAIDSIKVAVII